ncbi:MAG TPA: hypothetical protein VJT73_10090 [Polyangiaceae bacterium]|nr:hypothetical protein [Polyangiaceae bacterium]
MIDHVFRIREFLQRGIVDGGDAEELLNLLGTALDASATVLATPIAWGGFNLSDGLPSGWPNTYMAVRQWDPLIQRVCNPTVGTWIRGNEDLAHLHDDNPCTQAFFDEGFVDCFPSAGKRLLRPLDD